MSISQHLSNSGVATSPAHSTRGVWGVAGVQEEGGSILNICSKNCQINDGRRTKNNRSILGGHTVEIWIENVDPYSFIREGGEKLILTPANKGGRGGRVTNCQNFVDESKE